MFPEIFWNFWEHLFLKNICGGCFCKKGGEFSSHDRLYWKSSEQEKYLLKMKEQKANSAMKAFFVMSTLLNLCI